MGVTAALWHRVWSIAVAFASVLTLSLIVVGGALSTNYSGRVRRLAN